MLALSPVCEHAHRYYALVDRLRTRNPRSSVLYCRGRLRSGAWMLCVTDPLDLIERPWRLIEQSLADPHRRTTNGDTPEAEAAGRIDPTSSASLTPRTLAGTQVEQAQAVAILMPGCNGET